MRNIWLDEKKCKDMVINLLKYQPTVITSIQLNGIVIDRVSSYKLLRSAVMTVGHVWKSWPCIYFFKLCSAPLLPGILVSSHP